MTENFGLTRELREEEKDLPCCVRHEDAGGPCGRLAVEYVYGLPFCEVHDAEARLGALMEASHDAVEFLERFRNPHVPGQAPAIQRGIKLALEHLCSECPEDKDYQQALVRAYAPDIPQEVRERTLVWISEEQPGYATVQDSLLDSLFLVHKLTRLAFEERQTWLVEVLEEERQSVAAQAVAALEAY